MKVWMWVFAGLLFTGVWGDGLCIHKEGADHQHGLFSDRKIQINNPEFVSKSYPGFWGDLKKAGFMKSFIKLEMLNQVSVGV